MPRPEQKIVAKERRDLDYQTTNKLANEAGGFLRTGAQEGEYITIWHEGVEYEIHGQALIEFLFALKHVHVDTLHAALDLCDYIEKSAAVPNSVFVRDAIVGKADALKRQIRGES